MRRSGSGRGRGQGRVRWGWSFLIKFRGYFSESTAGFGGLRWLGRLLGSELVARLCVCAFVGRVGCEGCYSSCEV